MFEKLVDANDRGQVGIETLIIFIAMILVAAIAAGILINTAGFLQNKASATSEDSTEQVSNQIIVVNAIGNINASGTNVTSLNFTSMQSPGADEIDLGEATIEWNGPQGHTTMIYENSSVASVDTGNFTVLAVKDTDGSSPVLNTKDDRFVIHIPLSNDSVPFYLGEGQESTVKVVTQSGSTFTYVANVPESLTSDANGTVEV